MSECSHEMDNRTEFCRNCGQAAQYLVETRTLFCDAAPNVVGISHVVRGLRLRALSDAVFACYLDPPA